MKRDLNALKIAINTILKKPLVEVNPFQTSYIFNGARFMTKKNTIREASTSSIIPKTLISWNVWVFSFWKRNRG
jgi:hypothetical protein